MSSISKRACYMLLCLLALLLMNTSVLAQILPQPHPKLLVADSLFRSKNYRGSSYLYEINNDFLDTTRIFNAALSFSHLKRQEKALYFMRMLARKSMDYNHVAPGAILQNNVVYPSDTTRPGHPDEDLIPSVAFELNEIAWEYKQDFVYYNYLKQTYKPNNPAVSLYRELLSCKDSFNYLKISSIVNTYGWKGPRYFGVSGPEALTVTLMHSSIPNQKKIFSMIEIAALEGAVMAEGFAIIADNIAVNEGHTQIYGTFVRFENGHYIPAYISNINELNLRRSELGLNSLKEYLETLDKHGKGNYYLIK